MGFVLITLCFYLPIYTLLIKDIILDKEAPLFIKAVVFCFLFLYTLALIVD